MREDPTQQGEFKETDLWNDQKYVNRVLVKTEKDPNSRVRQRWGFTSNSLSGRERNRMFLRHGENFSDVTLVSGADDIADGRAFALIDFDQDGWQDIAMMSLNAPRFKLYRNEMKQLFPENKSFRFRLVGGKTDSMASENLSNRDAIGARVLVNFELGKKVLIQKQAGEGFASQNSETLTIGIAANDSVESLEVRWPSGIKSQIESPDVTKVLTIRELDSEQVSQ